jgi:hypothetical protein
MESFSQCPGEVYDSFHDFNESKENEIFLENLINRYKESIWYRENTRFKVVYRKEGISPKQKYYETMQVAIAMANLLIAKGYTVEGITTEYPSISDYPG